jgi:hypothetical protein
MAPDDQVVDRQGLVALIQDVTKELEDPGHAPWENDSVAQYLEALAAWLEDCDGYYENLGRQAPNNPWTLLAVAIRAARNYE